MKIVSLAVILALSAGAFALQEPDAQAPAMQAAPQTEQHAWLQQLVGDWTSVAEANMGPGVEPMRAEGTEHVRSIGGLWIQGEGKATIGGTTVNSFLTIGYDPSQKAFVGTWVDSMQTHLWTYKGQLDEARTTLTLETEGPDFGDPTKTARYRDVIELKSKDKKVLTSWALAPDGNWISFLTAEYTRKAKGAAK